MKNNNLKLTKLGKIEMNSINGGAAGSGNVTCTCASCSCGIDGGTIATMAYGTNLSGNYSGSSFMTNKKQKVDGPLLP